MTLLILALVLLAAGAAVAWLLWVNVINNAAYPLGVGIAGAGVALLVLLVLFGLAPAIANRIDAGIAQVRSSTASPSDKATPTVQRIEATAVPQSTAQATQVPQATARPANTAVPPTAVPAPANTAVPAPPSGPAQPPALGPAEKCPTDDVVHDALGLTALGIHLQNTGASVSWEGCKLSWQGNDKAVIPPFTVPANYAVTLQFAGEDFSRVYIGPVTLQAVKGMTVRYTPTYRTPANDWVSDPCATTGHQNQGGLMLREYTYGFAPERGSLTFNTVNGNIVCRSDGYSATGGTFTAGAPSTAIK